MFVLGIIVVIALVVGVVVAIWLARKQEAEGEEEAPKSVPADFVSPVSSGGYRFRSPDESPQEFHDRVDKENEEFQTQSQRAPKTD